MKNIKLSEKLISDLLNLGVSEFCVCAGARNSPLLFVLEKVQGIKLYHFFEERSASFFALGRMQKHEKPVVIVTTSGTAVAELLPATIEAFYTLKPLILLTADRPPSYRGSGAPQTIEQPGIFSHYVEKSLDIISDFSLDWQSLSWTKPLHLNICFDEPLIDDEVTVLKAQNSFHQKQKLPKNENLNSEKMAKFKKPLVIASGFHNLQQEQEAARLLEKFDGLIYAEALSNLHQYPQLKNKLIESGEKFVQWLFEKNQFDSVIALGGVPTLRFWRDLEEKFKNLPVAVLNSNEWTGLARTCDKGSLQNFSDFKFELTGSEILEIKNKDLHLWKQIQALLEKYPQSETGLIFQIAKKINNAQIYLGNSLPIREWDLVGMQTSENCEYFGNRGANGIDGQVSTFLGGCDLQKNNWCVVGDLTAMYDLTSLWASDFVPNASKNIIVINNQGGQIFDRMFGKDIFINKHQIEFSHWAAMWGWSYSLITENFKITSESQKNIYEVKPSAEQSKSFWKDYQNLWT